MQDHYAILGLPRNSSQELIKATYKALLKIYHPDVFQGDQKFATEQLKKINVAFEILSDPQKEVIMTLISAIIRESRRSRWFF